jgi:hypothetical protein
MKKKQKSEQLTIPTEHSYNDHTDFPPPFVHTENPTDINIESFSNPHSVANDKLFNSEKWQQSSDRTVTDSEGTVGIKLYDLVFIMAKEECYNEILSNLWDYSGFNNDGGQRFPEWKPLFTADRQRRSWVWYWLLCRWTIFELFKTKKNQPVESYYFSRLKKITLLALYKYENGEFLPVAKEKYPEQSPEQYIKVDEFEEYLEKIGETFIPLPEFIDPKPRRVHKKEPNSAITEDKINSFILKGNFWKIIYKGKETNLKNLERIRYIIHLLDKPGEEFFARRLIYLVKGQEPEINKEFDKMTSKELDKVGMDFAELPIEDLSKEEKERLEDRAYEYWNELQKAKKDGSQSINEARKHWDHLKEYLSKEYGILIYSSSKGLKFNKKNRLRQDAEKARQTVSKQVSNSINKDFKPHMPTLAKYLKDHITSKRGKFYYMPDSNNPPDWSIQW